METRSDNPDFSCSGQSPAVVVVLGVGVGQSTFLPLVYPGWGWGCFGTMVRTSACKAAVGVCVGSNPLADSLPLSLPSCGLRRVINFRCWLDTTSVCGTGHVSRSSLVGTGGITQVIFACHQLLTLFGFVIIF